MTQVFTDDGLCVPVTVIAVRDGNVVTQVRAKYRATGVGRGTGATRGGARRVERFDARARVEGWTTGGMDARGARDAATRAARGGARGMG